MSVLQSVLEFRRAERQNELADIAQIGQAAQGFIDNRRQRSLDQLNRQNILSQIRQRETVDPLDRRLQELRIQDIESKIRKRQEPNILDDLRNLETMFGVADGLNDVSLGVAIRKRQKELIAPEADTVNANVEPEVGASFPTVPINRTPEGVPQTEEAPVKRPAVGEGSLPQPDIFGKLTPEEKIQIKVAEKKALAQVPSAAQLKEQKELGTLVGQIDVLEKSFRRARKSVDDVPFFGKTGALGRLANQGVLIQGKLGQRPEVNVHQKKIDAFTTVVAKAAGEEKVSDHDARRFKQILPNLGLNDEENALIISDLKAELEAKGAKQFWEDVVGHKVGEQPPQADPEIDSALLWIEENPNDPRVPAVREKLKRMGAI